MKLRNFSIEEFTCRHCGQLPAEGMNPVLLEKLDELRDLVGYPIYVTSGYRCPEHNREVGGVENSQHVMGTAADVVCENVDIKTLLEIAESVGFDGIGFYPEDGFVHVDVRAGGLEPLHYRW